MWMTSLQYLMTKKHALHFVQQLNAQHPESRHEIYRGKAPLHSHFWTSKLKLQTIRPTPGFGENQPTLDCYSISLLYAQ